MKIVLGLVLSCAAAVAVAACDDGSSDSLTNARSQRGASSTGTGANTPTGTTGTTSAAVATNSPAGKQFYEATVHPILQATCGACHSAAGPGPSWFTPTDPEASYAQLFRAGYVVNGSRITVKGVHDGSSTNALSADQIATFDKWVAMELADGGNQAPPSVLAKLGSCFDQTKFDAMKMGEWRPTPRNDQNKPAGFVGNWNENADTCTGCRSACYTCHSDDAATGFFDAVGNAVLPANTTFDNTKMTTPPYITKFFAVSPDGKAIASNGITQKADSTMKMGRDTHPLLAMTKDQLTAIDAFVTDAVTKFNAGSCGK